MSKLEIAFSSPAFWSLIGAIAIQVITYILPSLSGTASSFCSFLLVILGTYLHPAEVQTAGNTQ